MGTLTRCSEIGFTLWWDGEIPEGERTKQAKAWIKQAREACGGGRAVTFSQYLDQGRAGLKVIVWTRERYRVVAGERLAYLERIGQGDSEECRTLRKTLEAIEQGERIERIEQAGNSLEVEDMVTIQQLADLTGKSVHTIRGRIYKARRRGEIEVATLRGGLLVNKEEGLKIAKQPDGRGGLRVKRSG